MIGKKNKELQFFFRRRIMELEESLKFFLHGFYRDVVLDTLQTNRNCLALVS